METKMKWLVVVGVLVGLALGLPAAVASADDGVEHGKIVFGDDYVLESGEQLQGDLAVLGGDVTLAQDSLVSGNVLVMGGSVTVAGIVEGDIAVFGGDVRLDPTSEVDGDIVALGGSVTRLGGAVVKGRTSEGFSFDFVPRIPRISRITGPGTAWRSWWADTNPAWTWFMRGLRSLVTVIVLAVLGVIVAALWPRPTQRLADTVWRYPGATVGMGLLTVLVVPGLGVFLAILLVTACLVPVLAVAAGVAYLFGWVGLGLLIGHRLFVALKAAKVSALWETCLGVAVITMAGSLPCLGWLVWLIGGAFGLGAVVLTRFGTRSYASDDQGGSPSVPSAQEDETTAPERPLEACGPSPDSQTPSREPSDTALSDDALSKTD